MTPFDAQPKVPPHRARRMLAALLGGLGPDDIGAEENLPTETVERALGDELDRRWAPTLAQFARIQIARLESYCLQVMDRVEAGELGAVDRALKILDRLDRYHGFRRAPQTVEPYGKSHRERLLAKLNAIAANLAADAADDRRGA